MTRWLRRIADKLKNSPASQNSHGRKSSPSYTSLLILIGFVYVAYYEVRFGGLWIENDTAVFIGTTKALINHGNVFFSGEYSHGPGYTAWLATLSLSTGLSVTAIDTIVAPFIGMIMFLMSVLLLYRTVLRDGKSATIAVLLVFLIPELMFTVIRGNHEKLNIPFIVFATYSVIWFVQAKNQKDYRNVAMSTVMYFVCVFMNGITNDYFGALQVFGVVISAIVLAVLKFLIPNIQVHKVYIRRLWRLTLISGLVMLWVVVFVFPQANGDSSLVKTTSEKLRNLFVTQQASSNPYIIARQQWISPTVAHIFAGFHWAVILGSALSSIYILIRAFISPVKMDEVKMFNLGTLIAYVTTVVIAIPIDFLGLNAGTNLELRHYTYFALFAPPVIVSAARLIQVSRGSHRRGFALRRNKSGSLPKRLFTFSYVILIGVSLLKSTLDPSISRSWMNYSVSERQALTAFGSDTHDAAIWTGPDNRLADLYFTSFPNSTSGDKVVGFTNRPYVTYILVSPIIYGAAVANQIEVPSVKGMNRLFDDGGAQIYQDATSTPLTY